MMQDDILKVLISERELKEKITELGRQISQDYLGREPVLISILRGSYIFMADLTRAVTCYCRTDFIAVSSYGAGTASSGQVKIIKDLSESIEGKDVILVEDILDTGTTLAYLLELMRARHAKSIRLAALLDKPSRRTKPVYPDYTGFQVPDSFVVGYGLDYDERYRNLPYIGVLKPEIYEKNKNSERE